MDTMELKEVIEVKPFLLKSSVARVFVQLPTSPLRRFSSRRSVTRFFNPISWAGTVPVNEFPDNVNDVSELDHSLGRAPEKLLLLRSAVARFSNPAIMLGSSSLNLLNEIESD
jgi:hypothetical protein